MQVYLTSFNHPPDESPVVEAFRRLAEKDRKKKHCVVDAPEAADILLFVDFHLAPDWRLQAFMHNHEFRRFRERVVVYCESDEPWVVAPGVYVSLPKRHFDRRLARAWAYYMLPELTKPPDDCQPDLLFSFVGSPGHAASKGYRVRRRILSLAHPAAHIEESSGFMFFNSGADETAHLARQKHFAEILGRSKFVLCPRGWGTSSIRLYEVMRAGRVPVILSDQWVAPEGPKWESFSLRLSESEVNSIPAVLESHESKWEALATAARMAYEQWFAPDVSFHHIVEQCIEVLPSARQFVPNFRGRAYRELANKDLRRRLRSLAEKLLKRILLRRRS